MNFARSVVSTGIALSALASLSAHALPEIKIENLVVNNPKIVYWNVQTTGAMRDGTVTENAGALKVVRPTRIQDGSVCHNYGTSCYCTPVKYRITPSLETKWRVLIDSGKRQAAECPAGVSPTGDADSTSLTREEAKARREAIMAEKKAKREGK